MDKRKKYFRAVTVALLLIAFSGYGKISDRAFRMQVVRMIAGERMIRLVEAQYVGKSSGRENRSYEEAEQKAGNIGSVQKKYGQKAADPVAETLSDRKDNEDRPRAALTFDDGPHATYTPLLLDGLHKRGIHATFFLMGKNIEGKEEIVKQMQKDGHLIGNHTYDHVQLDKLPGDQACQQILKTNNEIYEITGEYPLYLRPPYGAWPKNLELCVTMLPVFWDVDTLDWKSKNVQSVEEIVKREVKDGSIILMHDSFPTSVEAALEIADMLTEAGYDLVTAEHPLCRRAETIAFLCANR